VDELSTEFKLTALSQVSETLFKRRFRRGSEKIASAGKQPPSQRVLLGHPQQVPNLGRHHHPANHGRVGPISNQGCIARNRNVSHRYPTHK